MTQVIKLKNELKELKKLENFITDFVQYAKISDSNVFTLNLILEEHIVNVISYAYDDNDIHLIEVELELNNNVLNINVIDDGKPFDPTGFKSADIGKSLEKTQIGGLGIHFITQLTRDIKYVRKNNKNNLNMLYNIKM